MAKVTKRKSLTGGATILAYGGKAKLNRDIRYWRSQVKRWPRGSQPYNLAKAALDYLETIKKLG